MSITLQYEPMHVEQYDEGWLVLSKQMFRTMYRQEKKEVRNQIPFVYIFQVWEDDQGDQEYQQKIFVLLTFMLFFHWMYDENVLYRCFALHIH